MVKADGKKIAFSAKGDRLYLGTLTLTDTVEVVLS